MAVTGLLKNLTSKQGELKRKQWLSDGYQTFVIFLKVIPFMHVINSPHEQSKLRQKTKKKRPKKTLCSENNVRIILQLITVSFDSANTFSF